MSEIRSAFFDDMIDQSVLRFGDFVLKSGRPSPYFFNLGNISSGVAIRRLGDAYAARIEELSLSPTVLFGPAYKGIPLVVTTAVSLGSTGMEVDIAYNRKEAKGHGEGGELIGAALGGERVLVIDDVLSDGATKIEVAEIIANAGGTLLGVLVAFDRQDRIEDPSANAAEVLESRLGVPIASVARLDDLIEYMKVSGKHADVIKSLIQYRCDS